MGEETIVRPSGREKSKGGRLATEPSGMSGEGEAPGESLREPRFLLPGWRALPSGRPRRRLPFLEGASAVAFTSKVLVDLEATAAEAKGRLSWLVEAARRLLRGEASSRSSAER